MKEVFDYFYGPQPVVDPWFEARDYLLGVNGKEYHRAKAIEAARRSKHPDAVWFANAADTAPPNSWLRQMFWNMYETNREDYRALFFYARIPGPNVDDALHRSTALETSAALGYPPACVLLGRWKEHFAEHAMEFGGDPWLLCYQADRQRSNVFKRDRLYFLAARLGSAEASRMLFLARDRTDPFTYIMYANFLSIAQKSGAPWNQQFVQAVHRITRKFLFQRKIKYGPAIYWLGKWLSDPHRRARITTVLALTHEHERAFDAAIDHFQVSNGNARLAVDAWVLVGRRLGVVKDIRRVVAEMIWTDRCEYGYKLDEEEKNSKKPRRK